MPQSVFGKQVFEGKERYKISSEDLKFDDAVADRFMEEIKTGAKTSGPDLDPLSSTAFWLLTLSLEKADSDGYRVVRELVSRGANLDAFTFGGAMAQIPDMDKAEHRLTAAGQAIYNDNVGMLALCEELGADLSKVCRVKDECVEVFANALVVAILHFKVSCVEYLLTQKAKDHATTFDFVRALFEKDLLTLLSRAALQGRLALETFKVFHKCGVNFKYLEDLPIPQANRKGKTAVDFGSMLLANAERSGDRCLVKYFSDDVGLKSSSSRAGKVTCSTCGTIAPSLDRCAGCRLARYCSKSCQEADWKGDHKTKCSEMKAWTESVGSTNSSKKEKKKKKKSKPASSKQ